MSSSSSSITYLLCVYYSFCTSWLAITGPSPIICSGSRSSESRRQVQAKVFPLSLSLSLAPLTWPAPLAEIDARNHGTRNFRMEDRDSNLRTSKMVSGVLISIFPIIHVIFHFSESPRDQPTNFSVSSSSS